MQDLISGWNLAFKAKCFSDLRNLRRLVASKIIKYKLIAPQYKIIC